MFKDETILVTGGAGFIGTHLVTRLAAANRVRVFDNLQRGAFGGLPIREHPNVELVVGDVCDGAAVERAADGVTRIVHLASTAGVSAVRNTPVQTMTVILDGTRSVLEAARKRPDIARVIIFSTSEVYGRFAYDSAEHHTTPIEPVAEPRWTYAVSKIAVEHLAHSYFRELRVPTCSIRPFNIYGPGQVGEGAVHWFIRKALDGESLSVNFDGQQIRSWCYVDDIVDATVRAMQRDEAVGQVFNIGNPRDTLTVMQLAELVLSTLGVDVPIEHVVPDFPDVQVRVPNIDKARKLLGFEPRVRLADGLRRTIAWYRDR